MFTYYFVDIFQFSDSLVSLNKLYSTLIILTPHLVIQGVTAFFSYISITYVPFN